jgi:hypothetical protein
MPGDADLADDQSIQGGREGVGDDRGDRHATAREAEDDDIVAIGVLVEGASELPSGVESILEQRSLHLDHSPPPTSGVRTTATLVGA